jgi:hypothetical protein
MLNSPSLSNLQLEILKAYTHQLSETDLLDLKRTLASFFSQRLIKQADISWDEKKWNDADVDKILGEKMRRKSK